MQSLFAVELVLMPIKKLHRELLFDTGSMKLKLLYRPIHDENNCFTIGLGLCHMSQLASMKISDYKCNSPYNLPYNSPHNMQYKSSMLVNRYLCNSPHNLLHNSPYNSCHNWTQNSPKHNSPFHNLDLYTRGICTVHHSNEFYIVLNLLMFTLQIYLLYSVLYQCPF